MASSAEEIGCAGSGAAPTRVARRYQHRSRRMNATSHRAIRVTLMTLERGSRTHLIRGPARRPTDRGGLPESAFPNIQCLWFFLILYIRARPFTNYC